jgi:hypothetical protein
MQHMQGACQQAFGMLQLPQAELLALACCQLDLVFKISRYLDMLLAWTLQELAV